MEFVERGISGREEKREDEGPTPLILNERAIKEGRKNRVAAEVRAFSDEKLNRSDRCVRNVRRKPA